MFGSDVRDTESRPGASGFVESGVWSSGPFAQGKDAAHRRLRADAGIILAAAVRAVDPAQLVERALRSEPLPDGAVHVVAVGKAAAGMAAGAVATLGDRICGGIVAAPHGVVPTGLGPLTLVRGGHPEPDSESMAAGQAVLRVVREAGSANVVLALLSGGGSALVALPPTGVTLEDVAETTRALLRAATPIDELNAVRKHLDLLKGGRLARAAAPARTVALLLSDVPHDRVDVIASGPFSPDPTTYADALAVLRQRGLLDSVPSAVRRHLDRGARGEEPESPKADDACFDAVRATIVAGNGTALDAAAQAARSLGYEDVVEPQPMTGVARDVGTRLAERILSAVRTDRGPIALIAGGETTVHVLGDGRGGRNQELALAAALGIAGADGTLVASIGSDGIDGPTDAAGALVDGQTIARARALGLDAARYLERNDAWSFFDPLGDLIVTGPTGTNVMDIQLALARPG